MAYSLTKVKKTRKKIPEACGREGKQDKLYGEEKVKANMSLCGSFSC